MKKVKHNFRDTADTVVYTKSEKYPILSEINKLYEIIDYQERRCV